MRKIHFVKYNNYPSAAQVSYQVCEELRRQEIETTGPTMNLPEVHDGIVCLIKEAKPDDINRAKNNGNLVTYFPCDALAYPGRIGEVPWEALDGVIFPNEAIREKFPDVYSMAIPHHWDPRHMELFNKLRRHRYDLEIAYIGSDYSSDFLDVVDDLQKVYEPGEWLQRSPAYICHFAIREQESRRFLYAPGSKLVTAAAVYSNIIMSKDPSHLDLMDLSYPYYTDSNAEAIKETVQKVKDTFGTEVWWNALHMIMEVRSATELSNLVKHSYIPFFEGIEK